MHTTAPTPAEVIDAALTHAEIQSGVEHGSRAFRYGYLRSLLETLMHDCPEADEIVREKLASYMFVSETTTTTTL